MNILKLLRVSSYMTVQACERSGYMRYGVSESGALDSSALAEGAYLLGNDIGFGCIEFLASGGMFEYQGEASAFVVNGGNFAVELNGRKVLCGVVHGLANGDIIEVGGVVSGYVGYLHIGGGILVDEVLGSRSTNVRAALGGLDGRLLVAGDVLSVGRAGAVKLGSRIVSDRLDQVHEIRVMAGSGQGYYDSAMVDRFYSYEFSKSVSADRLGCVLDYDGGRIVAEGGLGIVSDAVILGDIQIQGDGRVVVLLSDRQPTGGYPRIGTVIGVDLVRFVQLGVGVGFCFVEVDYLEARALWLDELDRRGNLGECEERVAGDDSEYLLGQNLISGVIDGGGIL